MAIIGSRSNNIAYKLAQTKCHAVAQKDNAISITENILSKLSCLRRVQ